MSKYFSCLMGVLGIEIFFVMKIIHCLRQLIIFLEINYSVYYL